MFHRMTNYGELEVRAGELLTRDHIKKRLPKFRRLQDLVIIQASAWEDFKQSMPLPVASGHENSPLSIDEDELASLVCQAIPSKPDGVRIRRLAIETSATATTIETSCVMKNDGYHRALPSVHVLLGENGMVTHRDNQILFQLDVRTNCAQFFLGNRGEKLRLAALECSSEIVVDLFPGIGHFTLPLLVHAKARHVYACEQNYNALEALRKNLKLNQVDASRCTVIDGDKRTTRPTGVAQRVILGVLPSCLAWMRTALECVDPRTGAVLHCHDIVDFKPTVVANNHQPNGRIASSDQHCPTSEVPVQAGHSDKQQDAGHSSLNQSISSTSSHSTIEKLSVPTLDDSRLSLTTSTTYNSDNQETSSPVLLEKPASFNGTNSTSSFFDSSSSTSTSTTASMKHSNSVHGTTHIHTRHTLSHNNEDGVDLNDEDEDSIIEPLLIDDSESSCFESRGLALIEHISDELAARRLTARLLNIQPVRRYEAHTTHVVFDIKIEPQTTATTPPQKQIDPVNNSGHSSQTMTLTNTMSDIRV